MLRRGLVALSAGMPEVRGKQRVLRTVDAILRFPRRRLRLRIDGALFDLDTSDLIDFRLAYCGGHDNHVVRYIRNQIQNGKHVLWDIGANVGSISLRLAGQTENLTVHSFEPSPRVARRLFANIALNPDLARRVFVHQFALSDQCGVVPYFESGEGSNSGVGSLLRGANTRQIPTRVRAYTADAVVEDLRLPLPTIVKVDVEGTEYEVLSNAKFLEKQYDVQIIFESSGYRLKEAGRDPSHVVALLEDWGFEISCLSDDGALCSISGIDWNSNIDLVARRVGRSKRT